MPADVAKIIFGAGTFSIGAYVAAGGAGTLTDVGHTEGPVTLATTTETVDVGSEQVIGTMRRVPTGRTFKLKVPMKQAELERLRVALLQPAANLTGVAPDQTLRVGTPAEQYHQGQLVAKGPGTTSTRTITLWKLFAENPEDIAYSKGPTPQIINVTFDALYDESVTTADKHFKVVDS